jgi:molecular chaperone DnaK (HSP70)
MDRVLAEFYDRQFKSLYCTEESLFSMPKALVKLREHIEKQRKVLSANSEHQLHAESLVEDTDLTYNLTRVEFESIIAPVLNSIGTALQTLKSRMP